MRSAVADAGMRILVTLLLDTLPMLGNILMLCFFIFFIFGIIGVQMWKGLLRQRCYLPYLNVSIDRSVSILLIFIHVETHGVCVLMCGSVA